MLASKNLYLKDQTIGQLFQAQAAKTPNNTALVFEDQSLTYKVLNEKSNQLARVIRLEYFNKTGNQLQPDTLIALCLERSFEMIISILAVLKAGGAYVPIDPEFPKARIQYILEDTKTKIVLTQESFKTKLNKINGDLNYIAVDHYNFTNIATDNLPVYSQPNDLAYVIYTSGTTGRPKGVMVEHRAYVTFISSFYHKLNLDHSTLLKMLSLTSYMFDIFGLEYALPLLHGGSMTLASLFTVMETELNKTNIVQQTPNTLLSLCEKYPKHLSNKICLVGGEKTTAKIIAKLLNCFKSVYNVYGPAETVIWSTLYKFKNHEEYAVIGKPLNNEKAYILDEALSPSQIGITGNLYIGGGELARGYLNQPKLTRERFINNPFASQEDIEKGYTRLYKTGDLCRYLPDGNIEYIGRSDFQVKIRGFRIELGEIENAISTINGIKQVCVIAKSRTTQNIEQQYLAAFYVLDQPVTAAQLYQKTQITPDDLIAELKDKLPAYMIPSSWTELSALPLTTNGKVDRKALPEPKFVVEETYIAPNTDTEKKVCQIWQNILNIPQIGITDNFFKIGVDSIIAIRVGALLSERFNKSIYVGDIFKYQTIKALSNYIDSIAEISNAIPIAPGKAWPLSFAQQRLCFIEVYEKGTNAYHVPWLISLTKDININALKQSIEYIAKRHQILKTVFKQGESGEYYQVIATDPLKIQQRDYLSKNQLIEQVKIDVNQPFDLFSYYPIRVVLYKKSDTRFTHLLINVHHVAIDGWSVDILANELLQCYEHFAYQKPLLLTTLKIQYKDFACWQRTYLQGERLKTQLNYWRKKLSNYETLSLATDKPRPAHFELVGSDVNFILDRQLSNQLKNLAKEKGCTLYTLMLTGFYILLHKYTSQQDIIVGTPVANRHYPEIQNLIGFFVNNLILREQIATDQTAIVLAKQIQADLIQAQSYQDIPFEKLVTELDANKDTSRHPIFQIAFSVQSFEVKHSKEIQQYFKTESVLGIYETTKFDLLVIVDDSKDPIEFTINYASALFNRATIEKLALHYQLVLTQLIEKFGTLAIQNYQIITDQEYQKIVYQWNQTDKAYPKNKTLHQLFEAQVLKSPNNTALIFKDKSITYQELNIKSNQLARIIRLEYLNKTGNTLQPNTLIALCFERSFEMIISILAVLKAGGAYVPIDPAFPETRIQYILEDTKTKIVLTQERFQAKLNTINADLNYIAVDHYNFTDIATDNLPVYSQPNDLAYVIYTSGTTGKPKGVQINHSGVVNVSIAQSALLKLHSQSTVLQYASITFDASVFEIFITLLKCATLVICPQHCRYDISLLIKILQSYHIDIAIIPVSSLKHITTNDLPSLKTLVVAGETCPKGIINKWVNHKNVINAYGPTEGTVCATMHQYQSGDANNNIGKPIDNIKCYILNDYLQPVPIGVKGELYIAGVGLARGYLNQPNLTKERFITNPFATKEDITKGYTRLYKTGDLCRYLPDGNIEYIGRNDFQVKIRGFRIELGEIENALSSIPGVQSSVVIAQKHTNKPMDLIAYYICDKHYNNKRESQITNYWANLYNYQYQEISHTFEADFSGWNSYITGKALPLVEMQQWQEQILQRIKQQKTECIFEVGVGSGLLMYPLLPQSKHYTGIDISEVIINRHQRYFKSDTHKVKLFQGTADQIDQIMPDQQYDCIVINSVSQYFPHIQYFDEVMLKALKKLTPEGTIFIGDVRDYQYHFDLIEAKQVYHNHSVDQAVISNIAFKENELLIAPDYFLCQKNRFSDCSIDLLEKEGNYCNELNQYRYDVIIKKQNPLTPTLNINIVNNLDITEVAGELKRLSDNVALVIDGVINPWINQEKPNIINQYKAMAEQFSLQCKLHRKSQLGKGYLSVSFSCVDVYTSDIFKDLSGDITENYNIPWQSAIHQEDIIHALSQKLPQYMIPSYLMRLEKLPLTVNGKIDRKALPKYIPLTDENYVKPATSEEKKICGVWQSLLGVDKVGINSNFFRIGGNSILAIQAAFQMSAVLHHQISVADIFKYQTPNALAELLTSTLSNVIKPFSADWHSEKTQDKPIMYFIHPSCAGCEVYQSIAEKLLAHYHCIGIDNYNLYTSEQIISLTVLAKYYLSKLMPFSSPNQNITLLGWSLGGIIALEAAYWLEQQGYRNIHVILLDAHIPGKICQTTPHAFVDTVIRKMGIPENNPEYIAKIKRLFLIEQGIQQCQLSGKLQYSVVNLFQAAEGQLTNNIDNEKVKFANIMNIPTDHFGVINYIIKHWHIYAKAFESGTFEAVSDLKPIA